MCQAGKRLVSASAPVGITRPIDPTTIHEFGSELDVTCGSALILPTINMAYHLLKLEVLKEAYYYQDDFNSWMLRLVHRANKYPNYYHKELLRMPDGRETAEVIFWAKSAEGVKGIQEWFKAILGNQTLQDKVDESFAITCDMLAENFYKDPDMIEFFEEYGPLMVGAYGSKPLPNVNNKNQKKKGK